MTTLIIGKEARVGRALVGLALGVMVSAAGPATAGARTYVTGTEPLSYIAVKPDRFTAGTGVGGGALLVTRMHWTRWSRNVALGRGRLRYNTCKPSCAGGALRTERVRVRLTRPRRGCELYMEGGVGIERRAVFTRVKFKHADEPAFVTQTTDTEDCQ